MRKSGGIKTSVPYSMSKTKSYFAISIRLIKHSIYSIFLTALNRMHIFKLPWCFISKFRLMSFLINLLCNVSLWRLFSRFESLNKSMFCPFIWVKSIFNLTLWGSDNPSLISGSISTGGRYYPSSDSLLGSLSSLASTCWISCYCCSSSLACLWRTGLFLCFLRWSIFFFAFSWFSL